MSPSRQRGFTLIELLVSVVVLGILGAGLASLMTSQFRFQRIEDAMADSRSGARSALNVLRSDMRMLEGDGALVSAAERDIVIRVPYSFGIVCASGSSQTDVSLLPADTTAYDAAGFSGWAWRDSGSGDWTYIETSTTVTEPGSSSCDDESVEVLSGGRVVRLSPGVSGLAVGTPAMLFQRIEYRFDESEAFPGRDALYRTVVATDAESELVAPFASTARFRFHTDWDDAQDAVPSDLSTIVGFEIGLDAESAANSPRSGDPEAFSLDTSIFFKNVSN